MLELPFSRHSALSRNFSVLVVTSCFLLMLLSPLAIPEELPSEGAEKPVIDGEWIKIAGNPDLGAYTSKKQQPVDFGIWQAADGTWQLWSCIRHTKCGGHTRLFYRWEGEHLTDPHWRPMGIAMEADEAFHENPGGLQAPHVIQWHGEYWMFYGDWGDICLAKSRDGKTFHRVDIRDGKPQLFSGPMNNTRDAMVLRVDDTWYCYYTGHTPEKSSRFDCAVFCRTSEDLIHWSDAAIVSAGGSADPKSNWYGGSCECPFVEKRGEYFYLFRNQVYGHQALNTQYCSKDPLDFGIDSDEKVIGTLSVAAPEIILHQGRYFIASLLPGLDGIRIAPLKWVPLAEQE